MTTQRITTPQRAVLDECIADRDGQTWKRGHGLQTINALQARGWATLLHARYRDDDTLVTITEAGRAAMKAHHAE